MQDILDAQSIHVGAEMQHWARSFPAWSHGNSLSEQEVVNIGARLERRALSKLEVWCAACVIVRWQSASDVADPTRVTH